MNLTRKEKAAISDIDCDDLRGRIEQSLSEESSAPITRINFNYCGQYIWGKVSQFEAAVGRLREAKSAKNKSNKKQEAIRAGYNLSSAVSQMKDRVRKETEESERFVVDDHFIYPRYLSPNMSVTIRFRYADEGVWKHGSMNVTHTYREARTYYGTGSTRKLSKAKQQDETQRKLLAEWEHLKQLSWFSVKEFFENGGDGSEIPETFAAVTDKYSGGLNNFSVDFWKHGPEAKAAT